MTSKGKGTEGTRYFFSGSEEQVMRGVADMKKQYTSPDAKRYATTMAALTPLVLAASSEMQRMDDNKAALAIAEGVTQAFISAALNVLFNNYSTADAVRIWNASVTAQMSPFINEAARRQA